jgi:hypothetical protein
MGSAFETFVDSIPRVKNNTKVRYFIRIMQILQYLFFGTTVNKIISKMVLT